jgi:hypothetical protein
VFTLGVGQLYTTRETNNGTTTSAFERCAATPTNCHKTGFTTLKVMGLLTAN